MFKIVKSPRAWWPVTFQLPGEDGKLVDHQFELRFRLLKVTEALDYMAKVAVLEKVEAGIMAVAAGEDAAPTSIEPPVANLPARYAELVEEIADDWRGVGGENGIALPWERANLVALMNETGMFRRVSDAFRDCLAGRAEIRAGN